MNKLTLRMALDVAEQRRGKLRAQNDELGETLCENDAVAALGRAEERLVDLEICWLKSQLFRGPFP